MAVATGMKFGVEADFIYFDAAKWSAEQKKSILKAMKLAAKEWLKIILQRTPRDSGFLVAAFSNLAAVLGVSINGGQFDRFHNLKRGLDTHGKMLRLNALEDRFHNLRNLAVVKNWIKPKYDKQKITGYKRNIGKPFSKAQVKARVAKYKKEQSKLRRQKGGASDESKHHVGELLNQGLSIRGKGSIDSGEKKSANLYRREQNVLYYAQQRERKSAQRVLDRLAKLRSQIKSGKVSYNKAADKTAPLKMTRKPRYYKWESVVIKKEKTVTKQVEVHNPAYSARAIIEARKNKTAPPPKTILQLQSVTETHEKTVKRRVKLMSENNKVDVYRKYYYPKNKQRGPIKNPLSGATYGTPVNAIFQQQTGSGAPQSVSEETTEVNKKGFEVPGKELGTSSFTPASSLASAKFTQNAGMKITFQYGVDIRYWRIMDQIGRYSRHGKPIKPMGAPWGAFTKANITYQAVLKTALADAIIPFQTYCVKTTSKFAPGFKGGL